MRGEAKGAKCSYHFEVIVVGDSSKYNLICVNSQDNNIIIV